MPDALARLIAFYLPQFHPIPENDQWWGRGFTEWTNAAKAKPLFRGHYQPHIPADLGFYDLRLAESRQAQADLARAYGIEAFCYYHYWFAGRRILERPFQEVLSSGHPDFPFCLCWANQTWTGVWHGAPDQVLIEQNYPGEADHRSHFEALLPAFQDPRYVRVEGKPLFVFFRPLDFPDPLSTMRLWRKLAADAGLAGLHLVGTNFPDARRGEEIGLDAVVPTHLPELRPWVSRRTPVKWLRRRLDKFRNRPTIYDYAELLPTLVGPSDYPPDSYPCLIPNWDNTPRSGRNGLVLHRSTPELFERCARETFVRVKARAPEKRLVFLKSWNEWAEGNHLEPDLRFGTRFLEALQAVFCPENSMSP